MTARTYVVALTVLALVLRLIHLDNALWLDEISTLVVYGPMSVWEVMSSYPGSNNHVLNTLLMKACVAVFGEGSASLRLPALLFGVAGVPAIYVCARVALSERASLAAAAMLAVAHQDVFFSQNARGYTAWLFFSLLGAGYLARALQDDEPRTWGLFLLATVGNFASLLLSAFVAAGHALTGGFAVVRIVRQGGDPKPLLRRLVAVFGLAGLGGLLLYVWVLPEVLAYVDTVYREADVGFSLFSAAFLAEVAGGLTSGRGGLLLLAAPVGAIVGGLGIFTQFRASPTLTLALFLGPAVQVLVVATLGLSIVPRHFLLAMPLAFLVVAAGVEALGELLSERTGKGLTTPGIVAAVVLFGLLSAVQLRGYYAHPKQDVPSALEYLAEVRRPAQRVIALHLAELPVAYYGPRYGFEEDRGVFFVRTIDALDAALADPRWEPGYLVMTLPRALDVGLPALSARVRADWELVETFPGSLGDADVTVWRERPPAAR